MVWQVGGLFYIMFVEAPLELDTTANEITMNKSIILHTDSQLGLSCCSGICEGRGGTVLLYVFSICGPVLVQVKDAPGRIHATECQNFSKLLKYVPRKVIDKERVEQKEWLVAAQFYAR